MRTLVSRPGRSPHVARSHGGCQARSRPPPQRARLALLIADLRRRCETALNCGGGTRAARAGHQPAPAPLAHLPLETITSQFCALKAGAIKSGSSLLAQLLRADMPHGGAVRTLAERRRCRRPPAAWAAANAHGRAHERAAVARAVGACRACQASRARARPALARAEADIIAQHPKRAPSATLPL